MKVRIRNEKGGIEISTLKSKELDPIVIRKMKMNQTVDHHRDFSHHPANMNSNRYKERKDFSVMPAMIRSLDTSSEKGKRKKHSLIHPSPENTISMIRKAYESPEKEKYEITGNDQIELKEQLKKLNSQNKAKQMSYTRYKFKVKLNNRG